MVLGTRACELSEWKESAHLETLAAAPAEAGDYANAIRRQQEAVTLVDTDSSNKKTMMERLHLYHSGKPYRDVPPTR